jgi:hypothetical protein
MKRKREGKAELASEVHGADTPGPDGLLPVRTKAERPPSMSTARPRRAYVPEEVFSIQARVCVTGITTSVSIAPPTLIQ